MGGCGCKRRAAAGHPAWPGTYVLSQVTMLCPSPRNALKAQGHWARPGDKQALPAGVTAGGPAGLTALSAAAATLKPRAFPGPRGPAPMGSRAPQEPLTAACSESALSLASQVPSGLPTLCPVPCPGGAVGAPAVEPEGDTEATVTEQSLGHTWRHVREAAGGSRGGPAARRRRARGPQGGPAQHPQSQQTIFGLSNPVSASREVRGCEVTPRCRLPAPSVPRAVPLLLAATLAD